MCGGSAPSNEMMMWYLQEFGILFSQGWYVGAHAREREREKGAKGGRGVTL